MRRIATIWKMQLFLFATVLFAPSCTEHEDLSSAEEEGIAKTIRISVAVPPDAVPQTRAIDTPQENTINTIDLLSFRVDNTGEYFDYYGEGKRLTSNTDNGSTRQTFDVDMKVKTTRQRLVIITNADKKVKELMASRDWKNTEKSAMLKNLKIALQDGDHWKVISADDYTALAMWGESEALTITNSTEKLEQIIPLLRMVAKINVQLSDAAPGKFKLKSVRLYNTHYHGFIVPDASAVKEQIIDGERYLSVTEPTVPSEDPKHLGPLVYTDFSAPGVVDVAMRGAIYTFESEDPVGIDRSHATGLVVGGIFGTDTHETYYRVDFLGDDNKTYLDILRNHQYIVNIVDVKQGGYDNPDDAWNGASENLDIEILTWDESGMNNIMFNNQFYLSVSQEEFAFARASLTERYEGRNVLRIKTNYTSLNGTSGWHIDRENIVGEDGKPVSWLTVSEDHGDPEVTAEVLLFATENTTGTERKATLYVSAGRFRFPINVTQTLLVRPDIKIFYGDYNYGTDILDGDEIYDLIFTPQIATPVPGQDITVQWEPRNSDLLPFSLPFGNFPFFTTTSNISVIQYGNGGTGLVCFGIISNMTITSQEVGPGRPFYQRSADFVFRTSNGIADFSRTITMHLIYPDITIAENSSPVGAELEVSCPMGRMTPLHVRSNASWDILSISDPGNMITNKESITQQSGNADQNGGTLLNVGISNNSANLSNTATIYFQVLNPSTNPKFTGMLHHIRSLTIHATN